MSNSASKPKPKRLGDLAYIKDAINRVEKAGENAKQKDIILFVAAWLNDEITDLSNVVLKPINRLTLAAWALFGSVIAGIIVYIVMDLVSK